MEKGSYRVRIRSSEIEVEVEAPDREYVDAKVAEILGWMGFDRLESTALPLPLPQKQSNGSKPVGLAEHVKNVAPSGGLEYVLAVGYYLEHHREMTGGFRRRDLSQAFRTLKYSHSNPGVPIAAGRKQGLLIEGAEEEKMRLSETADEWVRARLRGE